jgi:hypothetical protein
LLGLRALAKSGGNRAAAQAGRESIHALQGDSADQFERTSSRRSIGLAGFG